MCLDCNGQGLPLVLGHSYKGGKHMKDTRLISSGVLGRIRVSSQWRIGAIWREY